MSYAYLLGQIVVIIIVIIVIYSIAKAVIIPAYKRRKVNKK